MKNKDKKGLWKFLLGLLKIIFRVGSKHLEKKLDEGGEAKWLLASKKEGARGEQADRDIKKEEAAK